MSTTTDKLALFKYDPSTDGAQTFNIQKALNDNWDKLDDAVKALLITLANKAPATHAAQHAKDGADPITPESIGAAPGGFGLGEKPKYIADANDAVKNGWYTIDESTLNLPGPNMSLWNYTYLRVDVGGRPDTYIKQTITSPYQDWHQCEVTRCFYSARGGWQHWEWVNPPMLLGVEYRTTERYNGKPVYKKLVGLGEAPSTKATKEIFPFGNDYNAGTYNVFSIDAHVSNYQSDGGWTITMPHFNINGELVTCINFSGRRIDFYSTGMAGYYGFALLKYTKPNE